MKSYIKYIVFGALAVFILLVAIVTYIGLFFGNKLNSRFGNIYTIIGGLLLILMSVYYFYILIIIMI